ncbi:hypothetical protein [Candidatus Symbiopectobacterium sp. NZEC151]|uniref:hypothetical protein n=1 Tax=Candidatus Symbiopectobacterium sp. NZEC151 TaxID=2820470 RepID=UPI002227EC1F|nr:hypothetical protein [Candidatus Symbiopectobacterium sp. NZEC151]MCW2477105.1 hypothetical protein [Candidatus Symbiopectobacterium sp. NZEC151]
MFKEVDTSYADMLQENVLLANKNRVTHNLKISVVAQAREHAKKIIREANRDAEAIRQQAYRNGYEHGVMTSIETVTRFIEDKQGIVNEIYGQVRQQAKRLLSDTVNKESVICALFESWADEIDGRDDKTPFYILLPDDRRRYKRRLMAYIDSMHRGGVIFEYHQDLRYVFKYREQLVEFLPETFVDNQIDTFFDTQSMYESCEQLSQQTLEKLYAQLEMYSPPSEVLISENDDNQGKISNDND